MPLDFDPPFCPSRMLMGSNNRAINRVLLPIDLSISVTLLLQRVQYPLPNSGLLPPIKTTGHRAPRTIIVGKISPRRASSQDPEDPIDDQTMIVCCTTNFWLLGRQQGVQLLPLLIR